MYAAVRSTMRRQSALVVRRSDRVLDAVGTLSANTTGDGAWLETRGPGLPQQHQHAYASSTARGPSSINEAEASKFAQLSASWWDPNGPFKPLHAMNKARCEFIKGVVDEYIDERASKRQEDTWLNESTSGRGIGEGAGRDQWNCTKEKRVLRVLDVGCGGGILSESLATMPLRDSNTIVSVLGIDVNQEGINTAMQHRQTTHPCLSSSQLAYRALTIEDLLAEVSDATLNGEERQKGTTNGLFDVTIASEVIEHVDHPQEFCRNLIRATAPGGRIIISTLNRTAKSYGMAILAAETLLGMVPEGTHDWSKFLKPEEVVLLMTDVRSMDATGESLTSLDTMAGMVMNPLSGLWRLDGDDVDVNYIQSFRKKPTAGTSPLAGSDIA